MINAEVYHTKIICAVLVYDQDERLITRDSLSRDGIVVLLG